jgi:hypothetical protein
MRTVAPQDHKPTDMGAERGKQTSNITNAIGGKMCAEEIHPDDGRVTFENPKDHKGDWGRHPNEKQLDVKNEKAKG